jgi:predicted transposase/invertase (TIGR01784 family)
MKIGIRAVFYACQAYTDQLKAGEGYNSLCASYSICLLMRKLWNDDQIHHHFRLMERSSGRVLPDSIEIHTVELSKYNVGKEELSQASQLEQWCYWIKNSSEHTAEELRVLLPLRPFLRATGELSAIQQITEERQVYETREKAMQDIESNLVDAREEGEVIGIEKGEVIGIEIGIEKGEAIGQIRMLQELLGETVATKDELKGRSVVQLTSMKEELQSTLRKRKT